MSVAKKPGRPLGVTLAILASIFLFCILPLVQVLFLLLLRQRIYFAPDGVIGGGTDVLGVSDPRLILQTILGVIYLIIAVLAWRGRPAYIRFVMVLFVLAMMILTIILNILPNLNVATCTQLPCDSADALDQQLARLQLLFTLLITFYVVWYMNRGPARAFYRGYYLPDPAEPPMSAE